MLTPSSDPVRFLHAIWKEGGATCPEGSPVHVSMNDYLIHRWRDVPRVAREGLILRHSWPDIPGTLGLWFAAFGAGRRQVSISIWQAPEDLRVFVRSPVHRRIMREHRDTGSLHTSAWTAERLNRDLIWNQAADRLSGRIAGVPNH